jgi:hypothetical protein
MNKDITYILDGKMPRLIGELPKNVGNYEVIAPSSMSESILKVLNGKLQ